MTLRKWQQEYRDRIAALSEEDLFDEMMDAQIGDGWDGCFTDRALWRSKESIKQVRNKHTRNAKLAALVTPGLSALLERLVSCAENVQGVGRWSAEDEQIDMDVEDARALAARIRVVLEPNDA